MLGFTCFNLLLKQVRLPLSSSCSDQYSLAVVHLLHISRITLYLGVLYLKQMNFLEVKSCRFCGPTCFSFLQTFSFFPLQNS